MRQADLIRLISTNSDLAVIEIQSVRGSSPRESGVFMLVSAQREWGTIGGGALEYFAINQARALLSGEAIERVVRFSLGTERGQCCGGEVTLSIDRLDSLRARKLEERLANEQDSWPCIYIFGYGHVGRALTQALKPLPFRLVLVETREGFLSDAPEECLTITTAIAESVVREAEKNSAFVIMTHSHALDFCLAEAALLRGDSAYVGVIGSATKRARLLSYLVKSEDFNHETNKAALSHLTMPLGLSHTQDKRPEVIAALTVAEITLAFHNNKRPGHEM